MLVDELLLVTVIFIGHIRLYPPNLLSPDRTHRSTFDPLTLTTHSTIDPLKNVNQPILRTHDCTHPPNLQSPDPTCPTNLWSPDLLRPPNLQSPDYTHPHQILAPWLHPPNILSPDPLHPPNFSCLSPQPSVPCQHPPIQPLFPDYIYPPNQPFNVVFYLFLFFFFFKPSLWFAIKAGVIMSPWEIWFIWLTVTITKRTIKTCNYAPQFLYIFHSSLI